MYNYQMGGNPQQEIITAVAQAIKQGVNPNEIMKGLVKMGMSQEEAMNMIRSVAQSVQQTDQDQSQMQQQGPQMAETMKGGGTTMSGTSWYGGGGSYIPSYGEYAYGGYHSEIPRLFNQPVDRMNKAIPMASGGSYDNAGFEALPEYVQEKIMRASGKAMYGMGMMANGGLRKYQSKGEVKENLIGPNKVEPFNINRPSQMQLDAFKNSQIDKFNKRSMADKLSYLASQNADGFINEMQNMSRMQELNKQQKLYTIDPVTERIIMNQSRGGQMPQWLAERRFTAAGNRDMMDQYGYAEGGEYNIGDEIDVTPEQLEMLKQQGYKFEILD